MIMLNVCEWVEVGLGLLDTRLGTRECMIDLENKMMSNWRRSLDLGHGDFD